MHTDRAPRVWDLFCCAGAASVGYSAAGLKVVGGVDIVDRPRYPFPFVQRDAVEALRDPETVAWARENVDLIHASIPCQAKCALTLGTNSSQGWGGDHVDLYPVVMPLLYDIGVPAVIENPSARADVVLCGEMFGLGVLRHRRFELVNWSADFKYRRDHKRHRGYVRGWRHGEYRDGPYIAAYGDGGGKATIPEMQEAMGIPWTDEREELTEAIPPAYTQWIGRQFVAQWA